MDDDRRRRGRQQRRQVAIEAALELFESDGYEATTVEAVARAAGVSQRSFYRYFDSKDGVLAALGSDLVSEVLDRTEGAATIAGLARTFAAVSDERLRTDRTDILFRLLRQEPALRQRAALWREEWSQQVADALAARDGRTAPSVDDLVVGRTAVAMMAVGLDRWLADGGRGPTTPHVDRAVRALERRLS